MIAWLSPTTVLQLLGMLAVVVYVHFLVKGKAVEATSATNTYLKEESAAQKSALERKEKELVELKAEAAAHKAQIAVLETKTDITQVMKWLTDAQDRGQQQYTGAMKLLETLMTTLNESSLAGVKQSQENFAAIMRVVKSMESLSRRFGTMEGKVDELVDAADDPPTGESAGIRTVLDAQLDKPEKRKYER